MIITTWYIYKYPFICAPSVRFVVIQEEEIYIGIQQWLQRDSKSTIYVDVKIKILIIGTKGIFGVVTGPASVRLALPW